MSVIHEVYREKSPKDISIEAKHGRHCKIKIIIREYSMDHESQDGDLRTYMIKSLVLASYKDRHR